MIWATLEIGKLSSDFNSESITGNETFNIVCHILKSYMEFLMKALQQAENKGLKTNGTTTSKREKKRKETRSRSYKWQQKHKQLALLLLAMRKVASCSPKTLSRETKTDQGKH